MADLPTGTVTFLFTDIEGSTARWEQHPEAMGVALARHDKILEAAIDGHGGVVFSKMGDGMAAAFASARDAVAAAVVAQQGLAAETWPELLGQVTARMGVHTGEGTLVEGQYLNQPLNRCARLMAIGHGGQVLVSGTTQPLVQGGLPEGVRLVDLGEHRLRDLSEPLRVFQVQHPDLGQRFPPLRSLDVLPGNLPLQVSSFVGRERELTRVAKALGEGRIVTLTGVGGVGKTRLALQVAAEILPRFRDGAWLIELAPVRDHDELPSAFAAVFNVTPQAGQTLRDALCEFLRTKQLLLVIDNCEHLLESVGDLVDTLGRSCGGLAVLATSREGLGLEGEQNLTVPSLSTPAATADLDEIAQSDAVSLFVERARRADADFALGAQNAHEVLQVCRRLDGVPLAIELAAAQVAAMTPAELAHGLDRRFETLSGGRRRAVERHQTLRATIDWSYDLLAESERRLLDRLAVFAGGCTREGAEAVCAGPPVEERGLFNLLRGLVAKSLVVAERADRGTRYRLLETIREYGEERLAASGETERLRDLHARYYAQFLGQVAVEIHGPQENQARKALIAERENLVAAMNHAIDTGNVDLAMPLLPIPAARVQLGSVYYLLVESLLELPGAADHPRYPYALTVAAMWTAIQGDLDTAAARSRDAAAAAERLGDPGRDAEQEIHVTQFLIAHALGIEDEGAAHLERIVEIIQSSGRAGTALGLLSLRHSNTGDIDAAIAAATEGLALSRREGMPSAIISNLTALSNALADRDPERARSLWRESVDMRKAPGYEDWNWSGAVNAVWVGVRLEDWPTVLELAYRTIRLLDWAGTPLPLAHVGDAVARALVARNAQAAAVLQGTARRRPTNAAAHPTASPTSEVFARADDGHVRTVDSRLVGPLGVSTRVFATLRQETTALLIEALGEAHLRELHAQGEAMDNDQAVAYALDAITKAQIAPEG
jgi:predicted ATPase/class 3 adenylate cyclase